MVMRARSAFAVPSGFCVSRPVTVSIAPREVTPVGTIGTGASSDRAVAPAPSVMAAV